MPDLDREEFDEETDRREYRRRRRIRNQVIAYVTAGVLFVLMIAGAGIGMHQIISKVNEKQKTEELQAQLDALSAQEEEAVVIEAPEESKEPQEEALSPLDELVSARIDEMPLEDKVAGLFVITPEALTESDGVTKAGDTTKEKITQYAVGGLVYFDSNIKSADQLKEMISNTVSYSKYPLFIAVDEEGGKVSRLAGKKLADNVGSMADITATGDAANAKAAGSSISAYLTDFGFNLDFAPVADVLLEGNTTIGDRSFGSNAGEVAGYVAAMVEGLQENKTLSATLKHFPGVASTDEDLYAGLSASEKTREDFETTDFLSFQAGIDAGADFVMVSHLSVPQIAGDNTPSSLSDQVIGILRNDMGFEGVIITDAMDMGAITEYYTADEAAVKALQAGVDMILMPEDFITAYQGVLDAVQSGTLSEERINESLTRIYRIKYRDKVEE